MRIALLVDGRPEEVEVDLGSSTVTVRGVVHPLRVVSAEARVELEVDGERLAVEGWPVGLAAPPGPVSVNGEVVLLGLRSETSSHAGGTTSPAPRSGRPTSAAAPAPRSTDPSGTGPGVAVVPPMPGKVIEVRVREGDLVAAGQILLVLEAMKMRNEVVSPIAGHVRDLTVIAGTNVRAREMMLRIVAG
jgi:glutaconyl-CoA decarboxylase